MQVGLGRIQTLKQGLWKAEEGLCDKAGCRQSQEAERGAWDSGYQEVRT